MSVLVTGGAGYIGSNMVLRLLDAGETVVVVDDLSTGHRWAVPEAVPFIEGDAGDEALMRTVLRENGIDTILHFAASSLVQESTQQPLAYYRNNVDGTRNLVAAALAEGVPHFVFSSSASVYASSEGGAIAEDGKLGPQSPYGSTKLAGEWMLRETAAAHDGFTYAALRYFNVAGADPQMRAGQSSKVSTHIIKIAAEAAMGKRLGLQIFGDDYATPDGTCVRDYIHVRDLADAHLDALAYLRGGGAPLVANCGYSRGFSVREVVDAAKRVSGVDFPVTTGPRRPGDPDILVADSTLAREVLGWTPQFDDLETIIGHALAWERRLAAR